MYKPVDRLSTMTERAQKQIETLIVNGSIAPGDRLPSERELGERLSVSRTVVREAMRLLEAKGLIEVRTGSGTYARTIGAEMLKAPLDLLLRASTLEPEDIHDIRTALEVNIAELAARRACPEDIRAMEETIETLKNRTITAREYAAADVAFHSHLAAATQNPLFSALVNSLNGVMLDVRLLAASFLGDSPRERAVFYHSRILDRIKAQDADGARAAMVEHLAHALEVLQLIGAKVRDRSAPSREEASRTMGP